MLIVIILFTIYIIKKKRYEKTEYYIQTKNLYRRVRSNKGCLGEYYIYKGLQPLNGYKRFLCNIYLPKEDGNMTEIDVILLHESGIYVFESKNYSGWIFGTEEEQYWTQTLSARNGKVERNRFFNPIIQNQGHIKWLQHFLKNPSLPVYSYIIFSNRCSFKDVVLTSGKHFITYQCDTLSAVQRNSDNAGVQLTHKDIDDLYEKLYPLTQIDETQKAAHIENIRQKQEEVKNMEYIRCPLCGGQLVKHSDPHGEFYGCSNYRTTGCRYKRKI